MNSMLTNLRFYGERPKAAASSKRGIDCTRRELLGLVFGSEESKALTKDTSPSVKIRIDTPVLRSQRPRQVISMTSKTRTNTCNFFPKVTPTKAKLMPSNAEQKLSTRPNLNREFRRLSIAQKKIERGIALAQAVAQSSLDGKSETEVSSNEVKNVQPQAKSDKNDKKLMKKVCDTKVEKKKVMRSAITFLRDYVMSLKAYMQTYLLDGPRNLSPVLERTKPPLHPMTKQDSYRSEKPSSNTSTLANSPEFEDKKKVDAKKTNAAGNFQSSVNSNVPNAKELQRAFEKQFENEGKEEYKESAVNTSRIAPQGQSKARREKKRRYTTPDEYSQGDFPKTTFDAIEKLAFEPVIK